jgi:hypothetical protein
MSRQLFRRQVPIHILTDLLDKICLKTDKYYLIDETAFRIMVHKEYHTAFCEKMLEYYHASKAHYVNREFSYNSFVNIVRQICKSNSILYASQMKYEKSKYNIDYLVYFVPVKVWTGG